MRRPIVSILLTAFALGCPATPDAGPKAERPTGDPKAGKSTPIAAAGKQAVDPDRTVGSRSRRPPPTTAPKPLFDLEDEAKREAKSGAPISLTASDGTGLVLTALEARGVVEAPLAFTQLRLVFKNPQPRTIEGRFKITLPPEAVISRFAMKIGAAWQEGEVVERQAARRAYEDFLHRKQDPALLEQQGGNEFTARVFPIFANADKELIISYSQPLATRDTPYVIPLAGLPAIANLDIRVLVGKATGHGPATNLGGSTERFETVTVTKRDWVPDRDLTVVPKGMDGRFGLRHENLVVARVAAVDTPKPAPVRSMFVLVDTSASRALGFSSQVGFVERLAAGLGKSGDVQLGVAAFDQVTASIYEGPAARYDGSKSLRARRALGASDLAGAIRWLADHVKAGQYERVLILTDGVATAGETDGDGLRAKVAALSAKGVKRVDAVVAGGIRDEGFLRHLVTSLPHAGVVIDAGASGTEIARRLTQGTLTGVPITVPNAKWVWPATLDGVQAGDEVLVYADLQVGLPFSIKIDDKEVTPDGGRLDATERPLLERAWVKARIDRLTHQRDTLAAGDPDLRSALAAQITKLSVRHRVLSPFTALLVLETEADYRRFNIDRRARADILVVGDRGIDVMSRTAAAPPVEARPPVARTARPTTKGRASPAGAAGGEPSLATDNGDDHGEGNGRQDAPSAATISAPVAQPSDAITGAEASKVAARPRAVEGRGGADGSDEDEAFGLGDGEADPASPPPPAAEPTPVPARSQPRRRRPSRPDRAPEADRRRFREAERRPAPKKKQKTSPYEGRYGDLMAAIAKGKRQSALQSARAWREEEPQSVLALLALGEAAEAADQLELAARAYGSLIDLFPSRADLRRHAGQRLERVGTKQALALAVDSYRQAVLQRPDHPSSHRLYAFALIRAGQSAAALDAILAGRAQRYPSGRFRGVQEILREDTALIAAAAFAQAPELKASYAARLGDVAPAARPSTRFILYWETDANDVDFHIRDGKGGHAYYSQKQLPSGGRLFADVTTGYGPECFAIEKPARRLAYPYRLSAHYYSRGPMGYGMGTLQTMQHDGKGGLEFAEQPFVIMKDRADIELGTLKKPL